MRSVLNLISIEWVQGEFKNYFDWVVWVVYYYYNFWPNIDIR